MAVIATALTTYSCAGAPAMDYTVSVDPAFTSDQIGAIVAAVDEWRTAVPDLRLQATVAACDSPGTRQICVHPAHDPPDPSHDVVGSTFPEASDGSVVRIYVERIEATGWSPEMLTAQTVGHELGHALGLRHSGRGTLMAPDVPDQAHAVTSDDVTQFWSVRGR